MDSTEATLEDFFKEIGFGEVRIHVIDKKPVLIPRQKIHRARKFQNVRVEITVDEPLHLK